VGLESHTFCYLGRCPKPVRLDQTSNPPLGSEYIIIDGFLEYYAFWHKYECTAHTHWRMSGNERSWAWEFSLKVILEIQYSLLLVTRTMHRAVIGAHLAKRVVLANDHSRPWVYSYSYSKKSVLGHLCAINHQKCIDFDDIGI
jgi:hypothetical protein